MSLVANPDYLFQYYFWQFNEYRNINSAARSNSLCEQSRVKRVLRYCFVDVSIDQTAVNTLYAQQDCMHVYFTALFHLNARIRFNYPLNVC